MPNRSLDDFVGGGEDGKSDAETEATGNGAPESDADTTDAAETEAVATESDVEEPEPESEADDETGPTLTVEEATPTYDFSPDGSTCEACGETVQTRWHDADRGMVCADCKRWD